MSVDGLQRRSSAKSNASNAGRSSFAYNKSHPSATKRSTINRSAAVAKYASGLDSKRRNNSKSSGVRNSTKVEAQKKLRSRKATADFYAESRGNTSDSKHDALIKDFLNEIQDMNPTELTDLPENEKKERRHRKKRRNKNEQFDFESLDNKSDKKKHKKRKILPTILTILLIIIGGGIAYAYISANDLISKVTDGGNLWDVVFSDPDVPLLQDENGRTNVLVFGTEGYDMNDPNYDGGYLTDSMMLVSLNQKTGEMQAVSLPRDLKTETCTSTSKINELFWCEYQKSDKSPADNQKYEKLGGESLEAAFEEVLGLEVHYRAHLNWQALVQGIDAIGGIDVVFTYGDQTWDGPETTIPTSSEKGLADGPDGNYHIQFPNGEVVHLNGEEALAVARARNAFGGYGAIAGNFNREIFQQRIAEAAMRKVKQLNFNLLKVLDLKNAIGDNLRTNFQDKEIKTLLNLSKTLNISSIESISLAEPSDGSAPLMEIATINGISYVVPSAGVGNYEAIHEYITDQIINQTSGGTAQEEAEQEAEIIVLNASGASGIASAEQHHLENAGFLVTKIGNAPAEFEKFDGKRIYIAEKNKPKALEQLKTHYQNDEVDFLESVPDILSSFEADFIVVLGNDAL